MKISDLAKKVKEGNLDKYAIEQYHTELTSLYVEMETAMADLEKKEAIYLNECGEKTRAGAERIWYATKEGQEMIELKHNLRASEKLLSSLKHRIYNTL